MQEMHETWVRSLNLKKEMATHSSVLAWRIPWTEEPGGPQFMESPFPGEGNGTQTPQFMESPFPGEGNGNPLQCSCLENSMDRRAWWATVHGVTKSQI